MPRMEQGRKSGKRDRNIDPDAEKRSDKVEELELRARRWALKKNFRKSARLYAELIELRGRARDWACYAQMLAKAGRCGASLDALKQAQYFHRREGNPERAQALEPLRQELSISGAA